jgi:Polyketide cyclase / dehydrase and lipid transport
MFEATIDTTADRERAWAALVDVTDWPRWTRSVSAVRRLDDGAFGVGSAARVKQPGMPALVWRVTELRDREAFTWEARLPGVRTVGYHRLAVDPSGRTRITVGVRHHGALSPLVAAFTGGRTRRYLDMELAGLKAAAERND